VNRVGCIIVSHAHFDAALAQLQHWRGLGVPLAWALLLRAPNAAPSALGLRRLE
jgi:hypothetical protein